MNHLKFSRVALTMLGLAVIGNSALANDKLEEIALKSSEQYNREFNAARTYAILTGIPMSVQSSTGTVFFRGMRNGRPIYWSFKDRVGAITVSTDKVWPGGSAGLSLNGAGVPFGLWDDGIPNHPELTGRIIAGDGGGEGSHGLEVASNMAASGLNVNAKGMAFAGLIRAYDTGNNNSEMATASLNGMRISNHSYGAVDGWVFGALGDGRWAWFGDPTLSETIDANWGYYGQDARDYDEIAYNSPNHLIIFAIGNQRGDGPSPGTDHWVWNGSSWVISTTTREVNGGASGFDTLPRDMSAKNLLTVGAISKNPNGYTGAANVRAASFTCFGPTDDGRIKPELVAPGVNMTCATQGGGYTNGSSGTSFSAPIVSGSIGLMAQHFQNLFGRYPRAATLKAVAINGADEAGATVGPDYSFGYGQLNTLRSVQQITKAATTVEYLQERTLGSGQTHVTDLGFASTSPIKITLAWNDPANVIQTPALNSRTPVLINDLDVRLIRLSDNTVIRPWRLDPANPGAAATQGDNIVDNVEQIFVSVPETGDYRVVVSHKGGSLRPSGTQDYSIIIEGETVGILKTLGLSPSSVLGGTGTSTGTITLASPQAEALNVTLRSANINVATVPTNLVIPAGATTASFPIQTRTVQTNTRVRISAAVPGAGVSSELTVRQLGVNGVDIFPGTVIGGSNASAWVVLDAPAPAGGITVHLRSMNETVARVDRNWVIVPAGATSTRFGISTSPVANATGVDIQATRGSTTAINDIRVDRAGLLEFVASPTSLVGGSTSTGTVTLNGPAPAAGVIVNLSSLNRNLLTVPATVVVPGGARTASFTIRTNATTSTQNVRITATRLGVVQNQTVTIRSR